jgi:triphosphoribosyl-dephospho-CoA synthase
VSRAAARHLSGTDVAAAAQLACLLEVNAPKPGNVSPGAAFPDARYEDFLASAVAIGPALAAAGDEPLGATIHTAVAATRRWTATNTNLGIVLLFAPLARAALTCGDVPLRQALRSTLAHTTVADACDAYAAIRLAAPGGLGRSAEQDVAHPPTVSLLDAMALARERDAIAREYVTAFATTFDVAIPALCEARAGGVSWNEAIVQAYVTLLAFAPDTHLIRNCGTPAAAEVQRRARVALDAGGMRQPAGRSAIAELDRDLRDPRNRRNPGATADLVAAGIFVTLLEGGWPRPGGEADAPA